ncbi:hypothetical protein TrLO_g13484 [Triparma laevis f. longispina]|nr:hypothetical protein TrLO_g13484 [Triparma laevis f. longispina]
MRVVGEGRVGVWLRDIARTFISETSITSSPADSSYPPTPSSPPKADPIDINEWDTESTNITYPEYVVFESKTLPVVKSFTEGLKKVTKGYRKIKGVDKSEKEVIFNYVSNVLDVTPKILLENEKMGGGGGMEFVEGVVGEVEEKCVRVGEADNWVKNASKSPGGSQLSELAATLRSSLIRDFEKLPEFKKLSDNALIDSTRNLAKSEILRCKNEVQVWSDLLRNGGFTMSEVESSASSVKSIGKDWRNLKSVTSEDGEIINVENSSGEEEEEEETEVKLTESMESLVEGLLRWGEEGGGFS